MQVVGCVQSIMMCCLLQSGLRRMHEWCKWSTKAVMSGCNEESHHCCLSMPFWNMFCGAFYLDLCVLPTYITYCKTYCYYYAENIVRKKSFIFSLYSKKNILLILVHRILVFVLISVGRVSSINKNWCIFIYCSQFIKTIFFYLFPHTLEQWLPPQATGPIWRISIQVCSEDSSSYYMFVGVLGIRYRRVICYVVA